MAIETKKESAKQTQAQLFTQDLLDASTEFGFTADTKRFLHELSQKVFDGYVLPKNVSLEALAKTWCCEWLRLDDPFVASSGRAFASPESFSALCVHMRQVTERYLSTDCMRERLSGFSQQADRTKLDLSDQRLGAVSQGYELVTQAESDDPAKMAMHERLKASVAAGSLKVGSKTGILLISTRDQGWRLYGKTSDGVLFDHALSAEQCPLLFDPSSNLSQINKDETLKEKIKQELLGVLGYMDGLEPLLAHLSRDTELTELSVANNPLGDAGIIALATALQGHPRLTHLDVSNTGCSSDGAKALLSLLKGAPAIQHIELEGNHGIGGSIAEAMHIVEEIHRRSLVLEEITRLQGQFLRFDLENKIRRYQHKGLADNHNQDEDGREAKQLSAEEQAAELEALKVNLFGALQSYWKERGGLETPGYLADHRWLQDLCDQTTAGAAKSAEAILEIMQRNQLEMDRLDRERTQLRETITQQEQTFVAWGLVFGESFNPPRQARTDAYPLSAWEPLAWNGTLSAYPSRYQQDVDFLLAEAKHDDGVSPLQQLQKTIQARRFLQQYGYRIQAAHLAELASLSQQYEAAFKQTVNDVVLPADEGEPRSHHRETFDALDREVTGRAAGFVGTVFESTIRDLQEQWILYEEHLNKPVRSAHSDWAAYHSTGRSYCVALKDQVMAMLLHPSLYASARSRAEKILFDLLVFVVREERFHQLGLEHRRRAAASMDAPLEANGTPLRRQSVFAVSPSEEATRELHRLICSHQVITKDAVLAQPIKELLEAELAKGAKINALNESKMFNGRTLLHIAFSRCNKAVVQWLKDKGVDPQIKNYKGQTAIEEFMSTPIRGPAEEGFVRWLKKNWPETLNKSAVTAVVGRG